MNLRNKTSELLTQQQKQAISEFTKPDNKSFKEIAKKVGISIKTLYRWRKKPEFSSALEESFHELKQKVETKVEASSRIRSYLDVVNNYIVAHKTLLIDNSVIILITETIPELIEIQNKFVSKGNELDIKLNNLKIILKEINRDIKKMHEEIETLTFLLR